MRETLFSRRSYTWSKARNGIVFTFGFEVKSRDATKSAPEKNATKDTQLFRFYDQVLWAGIASLCFVCFAAVFEKHSAYSVVVGSQHQPNVVDADDTVEKHYK